MIKAFILTWTIILSGISLVVTDAVGFVFWPAIEVEISVTDLEAIQKGDLVYMDGQAIGEVTQARLKQPQIGIIKAKIYGDYKTFINESAVFTIASDRLKDDRQCLLVKNCLGNKPVIKSGHRFRGYSRYRFETACLEKRAAEAWREHFKAMVEEILQSAGRLSQETIDKLKAFAQEHHDEFAEWMDELSKKMEDMAPEVRRQLDELMKEFEGPQGTTPDTDAGDSGSKQINT